MTKHTTRDRIWSAALKTAAENEGKSRWGRKFGATDVLEKLDNGVSARSVRDTLATMADLGHIERASAQGKYTPIEATTSRDRKDTSESSSTSTKDQKISSGPSTSSTRSRNFRKTDHLDAGDAALALEDERDEEDVQEAASVDVSELNLPGDGSTLEARRRAVRACYEYLRENGTATKSDFIEDVRPDHRARYGSDGGWWNTIGKKGLRDLARRRDDVAPPGTEGAHIWEYTG